ncbi:MAG: bifunctional ornithine acetyltransferase/N-acetylglutamate synthase, partial [Oscillospiraceae bacterium]|nr:bifunctional ornithine acetyltransferase/N-acetylglutamate synthase [Oscillospiraceae bacterium]
MNLINGGVCAPLGYKAGGVHCGIRKNHTKKDLALIVSEARAACAGVYTTNLVKGAPIHVTRQNIADGYAQAVICNSGNANTCNPGGEAVAEEMCALVGKELKLDAKDIIVASTGVIGQPLDLTPIAAGIPEVVAALTDSCEDACAAIMTTDTVPKAVAVEFTLGGKTCRIGGIAKGSGMIHPNMATMLVFVTSDASISPALLQKALSADVQDTFNMVGVDGDTSTND